MRQTPNYKLPLIDLGDEFGPDAINEGMSTIDSKLHETNGSTVPKGVICMWSGAQDAIPAGWALCDGQNNTPDLRGKFVLGAGSSYTVGQTGGEETHKLTIGEMPSHTHSVTIETGGTSPYSVPCFKYTSGSVTIGTTSKDINATGGNSAHNNMPPYWALCYIMKT